MRFFKLWLAVHASSISCSNLGDRFFTLRTLALADKVMKFIGKVIDLRLSDLHFCTCNTTNPLYVSARVVLLECCPWLANYYKPDKPVSCEQGDNNIHGQISHLKSVVVPGIQRHMLDIRVGRVKLHVGKTDFQTL